MEERYRQAREKVRPKFSRFPFSTNPWRYMAPWVDHRGNRRDGLLVVAAAMEERSAKARRWRRSR